MQTPKTPARNCPECQILMTLTHRHARGCSQHVELQPVACGADGFVRNAAGRVAGFADGNTPAGALVDRDGRYAEDGDDLLDRWATRQGIADDAVHAAVDGWLAGQRYATIAPGITVRVGKRRAA